MARVEQNQKRLQRMIRRTMRVVRDSEARLEQTNKLLDQVRALSGLKIKRPDDRINQSLQEP